jgi:glucan 1,3-beta-glucosidase
MLTSIRITPSVFQDTITNDEWSLCNSLGKDKCESQLRNHWSSFFTRDDLADIKNAGLNSIRIPIGYWAVDVRDDEPYVSGQYPYLIQAVNWAAELGLTVLIDLHGAPGSQNGQDNSGLIGPVLFPANASNADRSLNVIRNLTEEFSRDVYGGVVTG